ILSGRIPALVLLGLTITCRFLTGGRVVTRIWKRLSLSMIPPISRNALPVGRAMNGITGALRIAKKDAEHPLEIRAMTGIGRFATKISSAGGAIPITTGRKVWKHQHQPPGFLAPNRFYSQS